MASAPLRPGFAGNTVTSLQNVRHAFIRLLFGYHSIAGRFPGGSMSEEPDKSNAESCVGGMERREFIELVTKRAKQAGTLLASATVIEFFLAKPPEAWASTGGGC